jgi:hypothetical protein
VFELSAEPPSSPGSEGSVSNGGWSPSSWYRDRGHWAKIDLNGSVDSSVDAFCHTRKVGPPISNGNRIAQSNSNIAPMLATLVKTLGN